MLTLGATFYFLFIGPAAGWPANDCICNMNSRRPSENSLCRRSNRHRLPPRFTEPKKACPAPKRGSSLMAIVIDDMGYQKALGRRFLALDLPLSFSFLPHAPFTRMLMQQARSRQRDILLHIPLEPQDASLDLGAGALLTRMSAATMIRIFNEDLTLVPFAIGVNNHMGSKFTEDKTAMTTLLGEVKRHDLFFLDSLTTADSVGFELAEKMKIPAARRNVFLDNQEDRESVLRQLDTLVRLSRDHGNAIGIAHPKAASLEAIRQFSRQIPPDIRMVAVHRLLM